MYPLYSSAFVPISTPPTLVGMADSDLDGLAGSYQRVRNNLVVALTKLPYHDSDCDNCREPGLSDRWAEDAMVEFGSQFMSLEPSPILVLLASGSLPRHRLIENDDGQRAAQTRWPLLVQQVQ